MIYAFDEIDEALTLLPMAARRALDWAGQRLSLAGWQSLPLATRHALVAAGGGPTVNPSEVLGLITAAQPAAESCPVRVDPAADAVPAEVTNAFGEARPISDGAWRALSPLARYALSKVAERGRPQRLEAAYAELIGDSKDSPHLSAKGGVRMVDVGGKDVTLRSATAQTMVSMSADAFQRFSANNPKGDVAATARVAGIMAAKKTSEWIPLCHPLALTKVEVVLSPGPAEHAVEIRATVETVGRTGVEMEALTAVSAAALTVYDMLKAFDKAMAIGPTVLLDKSGGKSGDFRRG